MDPDRRTDMIRMPREEEFFERESVLGRDAASVFPSEAKKEQAMGLDAMRELIGAKKFISETELDSIRVQRSGTVEDGIMAADRPLAEILRENKQRKDEEFQEKWRVMKQGSNRPLDADEAAHFEEVQRQEAVRDRDWAAQQRAELDAFRQAVQESTASKGSEPLAGSLKPPAATGQVATKVGPKRPVPAAKMPVFIAVRPKGGTIAATTNQAGPPASSATGQASGSGREEALTAMPSAANSVACSKRQKLDEECNHHRIELTGHKSSAGQDFSGLSALLGGYGDDDGSDDNAAAAAD